MNTNNRYHEPTASADDSEGEGEMGEIINLNRYRKLRDQARRDQEAASNRAKFGRTKTDAQIGRAHV